MNVKTILLSSFAIMAIGQATAQDKLYKRNGDVMEVKVKEVGNREISYKRASNLEGPTYNINKNDVERIEYENGSEDVFMGDRDRKMHGRHEGDAPKLKYGKNILAIAPVQATQYEIGGVGIGLSYERVLDRKGIASFYLPLSVVFINGNNNNNRYYPYPGGYNGSGSYYYGNTDETYTSFIAMPGVKIYPTGSKGKVRYAVGPNLAIMYAKSTQTYYTNYPNPYSSSSPTAFDYEVEHFAVGMMVTNSLNMMPTPHLSLGLELGLGITYLNRVNTQNIGETGIAQFSFKIGYRF